MTLRDPGPAAGSVSAGRCRPAVVEQYLSWRSVQTPEGFADAQTPDADVVREDRAQRVYRRSSSPCSCTAASQSLRAGDHSSSGALRKTPATAAAQRRSPLWHGRHSPLAARSGRRSAHRKWRRTPGPLGILRARQAAHFVLAEQHAFNRRFQIRLLHQGGPIRKPLAKWLSSRTSAGMDAGFADHRDIRARRAAS